MDTTNFSIETKQETDGRWIAEVMQVSGALAYGNTREEAIARAEAIARQVLDAPERRNIRSENLDYWDGEE